MNFHLGEKWAYDPHHIISNKIVENAYAPYVHESRSDVEKIENGGQTMLLGGMEVELPLLSENNLKRGNEDVIDLEEK